MKFDPHKNNVKKWIPHTENKYESKPNRDIALILSKLGNAHTQNNIRYPV